MDRRHRLAHLLILGCNAHAHARITNKVPTREILVASPVGIAEHAFERQAPGSSEKRAQVVRLPAVDRCQHRIALFGRQFRKRRSLRSARERVHSGESRRERFFFAGEKFHKRPIDIFGRAALHSPRSVFIAGYDAIDEGLQDAPLLRQKS